MPALSVLQGRTLEALASAMLPSGGALEPGADDVGLAGQLEAYIGRCDPMAAGTMRLMLTAFGLSAIASRHLRPFHLLSPEGRLSYLHECERSSIRQKRETLVALKALLMMFFCADPRVAPLLGYDGRSFKRVERQPVRPELAVEEPARPFDDEVDVVIVGSGAGGSVVAKELAEAGRSVLVLEEGRHFDRADFNGPFPDRLRRFYRGSGLTFTIGNPVISLPMGMGVGGSTIINSGTCFRTPEWLLREWGFDPDEFGPLFEQVEEVIGVGPVSSEIMGANGELLEAGRQALGYSGGPIRRNARDCHGSGVCAFGCPLDAKQGMHVSYLPVAAAAGARVATGCRVERVLVEGGRAVGVAGDGFTVRAKRVVLAAGAVYTPCLLLKNRLALGSRQVGRNFRIHPGAGILGAFDRELTAWRGVMQSAYVDEKLRDGVLVEATYPPPGVGYSAGGLPEVGPGLKEVLAGYRRTAAAGLIISDSGAGRVRSAFGRPMLQYSLDRRDVAKVLAGIALTAEVYLAAGAREVHTMLPGLHPITSRGQLPLITEGRWRAADLKLSAYHPMGTARLGRHPGSSVVDDFGSAWEVPGLTIADASILPGSTYVNPQITIMALATRIGRRLAEDLH